MRCIIDIPFNAPFLCGREEANVVNAVRSRAHCGNRGYGARCIELMKERYGFGEVFLTPSCTAAMEMGALLADVGPGDEVILPSYTFSSTANAIVLRGARPVFCDVEPETMNIDLGLIEALIGSKTRLIMPIDYAGIPCEIEGIHELAARHGLHVLQDAAQSFHAFHRNGKACGSVPALAAFSFHETKNISCGEGGALVVNDTDLAERAHVLQEKGTDRSLVLRGLKSKYHWVDVGSSFLLADILAGMLLAQIERVEEIVDKRRRVTEAYRSLFGEYSRRECLRIPAPPADVTINHHAFFVIFDSEENQQAFLTLLKERHVSAYIGYVPLHSSPMGARFGYRPEDVPITEDVGKRIVRLPFYADLADDGLDYAVEQMAAVLRGIYAM